MVDAKHEAGAKPSPPTDLTIRARRPADAEALAEMMNLPGYRFGTSRLPFHSPEEVRGWIDKTPGTNLELVATAEGQLVGTGGLYRMTGRQSHVGGLGIGVHDDWTGRRIGTAILHALVDAADNWLGIRRLQLTVFTDNIHAIRLYRAFGFEIEGTHRAYALRDGHYADTHTMARIGGRDPTATCPTAA